MTTGVKLEDDPPVLVDTIASADSLTATSGEILSQTNPV